jgi:hypothetical protein
MSTLPVVYAFRLKMQLPMKAIWTMARSVVLVLVSLVPATLLHAAADFAGFARRAEAGQRLNVVFFGASLRLPRACGGNVPAATARVKRQRCAATKWLSSGNTRTKGLSS